MSVMDFTKAQWYKVRLIVTENRFQGFVDKKRIVNVGIKDRKIGMRFGEIEESIPLGISTFQTTGEFKNIKIRKLNQKKLQRPKNLMKKMNFKINHFIFLFFILGFTSCQTLSQRTQDNRFLAVSSIITSH